VEYVDLKPVQREIYAILRARLRRGLAATADHAALSGMGVVVAYLLEAATNPALLSRGLRGVEPGGVTFPPTPVPPDSALADRVLNYGAYEVPAKFEKLASMLAVNAGLGRKTLVWSNFVDTLRELADRVLLPYQPALIYGAIPAGGEDADFVTRERELRRFRDDPRCLVLLANPAAMSEGVSLHEECHDAIYVERTFNAGHYLQSIDRIHRLGLAPDTETRITFLVTRNTVDEIVDDRIRTKAQRLSLMLSDPNLVTMALPDDASYGEWVDPEDIDSLFNHLRDGEA